MLKFPLVEDSAVEILRQHCKDREDELPYSMLVDYLLEQYDRVNPLDSSLWNPILGDTLVTRLMQDFLNMNQTAFMSSTYNLSLVSVCYTIIGNGVMSIGD